MYSQNNEEELILKAIHDLSTGRFLDIGAFDGKTFSNTLALAERGWGGLCVEASAVNFANLMQVHRDRPAVELLNAAVVIQSTGLMRFWDSGGDGVSTLLTAHRDKWIAGSKIKFQPYWVVPLPLNVLFTHFGHNFQFVNIDVEGHSADLFMAMPWDKLRPRCICVEHDNKVGDILRLAELYGYRHVATNAENILLVHITG